MWKEKRRPPAVDASLWKKGLGEGKAASTASEMASAKVGWGRTGRSSCSAVSSSVTARASSEIRSVAR